MPLAVSDFLEDCLSRPSEKRIFLSTDQLLDAADMDSVSCSRYWIRYAGRLGLDYMILTSQPDDADTDSLLIECWKCRPDPQPVCYFIVSSQPDDSVISATAAQLEECMGTRSGLQFKMTSPGLTMQDYWHGRYYSLIDSTTLALHYLEQALRHSKHPDLFLEKARVLLRNGLAVQAQGESARHIFMEAEATLAAITDTSCSLKKTLLQAHLYIAESYWNRSEAALKKVMKHHPDRADVYLLLSRLHPERFTKYKFRNREQLYKKAIQVNPAYETAYLALGDWYYFNHRVQDAERVYQRLLAINPRSVDGLLSMGKLYLYRNDPVKLIETYEKVYKIRPESPEILYNLGIAYYNTGDLDRAFALFSRAASVYQYPDAYYYLGAIHLKQNHLNDALESFRMRIHLRKGPDDTFADEAVRHVYQILQQLKQAPSGKQDTLSFQN